MHLETANPKARNPTHAAPTRDWHGACTITSDTTDDQKACLNLPYGLSRLPVVTRAAPSVIGIPVHPGLWDAQARNIATMVGGLAPA